MTIPASSIVQVNPGVIGAGGSPLSLNGVIMSTSTLIPAGSVQSFANADAVKTFFGASSDEYHLANYYFLGYDNSTIKPGKLFYAPYASADRAAWLQGGSLQGMTLTQLQALTGVLTLSVDGTPITSATINLSAASSFSNAATLIEAGFTMPAFSVSYNSIKQAFVFTSDSTGNTATITVASGSLAAGLKLTTATGAILSQGIDQDTPATAMDAVIAATQNWFSFCTMWEPNLATKELFAEWSNAQNQRYMYICWDTDAQAIVNGSTTCFGYVAKQAQYDGVMAVYNTVELAVFVLGVGASINFAATNGRITSAFKNQSGFTATVIDSQIAANLLDNGYSFYGIYATANDQFNFFYNGQLPGKCLWFDTFADQVYMNSQFQLALMSLLTSVGAIPYNQAGYNLIRAAMLDPINQMLNFGGIRPGVTLSQSQKAQVNTAAGLDVAGIIEQQGYYLQILDPGAQVRGNRGTPVINFWYTDGGAVQQITLASIDII